MEDNISFQNCSEDEVVSLCYQLFKLEQLKFNLRNILSHSRLGREFSQSLNIDTNSRHSPISASDWFDKGINCEILKLGSQGWQKGKLRINIQVSLEFFPDEPEIEQIESPLDDLRKTLK